MPFSMAACRTVLPFSTVICWPSIVSVTVSITNKDITAPRASRARFDHCLTAHGGTFTFPPSRNLVLGRSQAMHVVDPPPPRLSFTSEWLTAAVFLVGTVLVAYLIVRELRVTP